LNAKKKDSARLSMCGAFGDGGCGKDEERLGEGYFTKIRLEKKGRKKIED
jgi:hypothetical protein